MADRSQKGLIPLQAALVFLRGPTPVQRPAPQLVGAPNKGREAGQDGQLGQTQGVRPEDRLEGRQVDDGGREDKFEEYPPEEQSVGEDADLAQGGSARTRGEGGADLAGRDASEGHRGGGKVSMVQRAPWAH